MASAARMASNTPGAGRADSMPRRITLEIATECCFFTKYSWNAITPSEVSTNVDTGESDSGFGRLD